MQTDGEREETLLMNICSGADFLFSASSSLPAANWSTGCCMLLLLRDDNKVFHTLGGVATYQFAFNKKHFLF